MRIPFSFIKTSGGGGSPSPTVTAVSPDLGDTSGGELLTLTGTNFTGATAVSIGGTAVEEFSVISATEIITIAPAHVAAAFNSVLVTTPIGTNAGNMLYEFWSPAELSLTGFWDRGNYQDATLGTWPGRASAGSSFGRNLTQASTANQPTEVGLEPDFDGLNDSLQTTVTMNDLFDASAGSLWFLFDADFADVAASISYDPALLADVNGAALVVEYTVNGVKAAVASGGFQPVTIAAAAGALHLARIKWDGVNLKLSVDSSLYSSVSCGAADLGAAALNVGASWNGAKRFNGRIRTFGATDTVISDGDFDKLLKWARACRGLES